MRFIHTKGPRDDDTSFKEDILIVPIVSTGNVGQLAVDLFLSTGLSQPSSPLARVGYLDTDLVVPAAGYEVFGPGQPPRLCVNLELFRLASKRITILQQRAPVIPGEEEKFAEELVLWAKKEGFKEVLALAGADAAQGLDPTPFGHAGLKSFRAGTTVTPRKKESESRLPRPCELEEALRYTGVSGLELQQAMADGWPMDSMGLAVESGPDLSGLELEGTTVRRGGEGEADLLAQEMETVRYPPLPTGTGISRYLCKEASLESGESPPLPLVVLMHFCGEGDNTPHAITMADVVNSSLKLFSEGDKIGSSPSGGVRWTSPLSWASLYGPPPEPDAYL